MVKRQTEREEIKKTVDDFGKDLWKMALHIHANPETCFKESEAVKTLTTYLGEKGFSVEKNTCGMETAFEGSWKGAEGGPEIMLLCEYDALPEIGHACGHNLIGPIAIGAATAVKTICPNLKCTLKVVGTPAEEGGGGKVIMADQGYFDNAAAVMMIHPRMQTMVLRSGLACTHLKLKYYGKATHASSSPEVGISALDAVIHTFVAVNSIRQFVRDGVRIHGIITNGGAAPNIIPEYAEAKFLVRAPCIEELYAVRDKVLKSAKASADAVGAEFEYDEGIVYAERNNNVTLAKLFKQNFEELGEMVESPQKRGGVGSSDIGNVGQITATIHPYIKITSENITNHNPEFTEIASGESARLGMITAAKAMALTVHDLCTKDGVMDAVRAEFEEWKINKEQQDIG